MNLFDETKGAISQSEHSTDDVRFVGSRDERLGIPWSQAEKYANRERKAIEYVTTLKEES